MYHVTGSLNNGIEPLILNNGTKIELRDWKEHVNGYDFSVFVDNILFLKSGTSSFDFEHLAEKKWYHIQKKKVKDEIYFEWFDRWVNKLITNYELDKKDKPN